MTDMAAPSKLDTTDCIATQTPSFDAIQKLPMIILDEYGKYDFSL